MLKAYVQQFAYPIACTPETLILLSRACRYTNVCTPLGTRNLEYRDGMLGITMWNATGVAFLPLHELELFSYWYRQLSIAYTGSTNPCFTFGRWVISHNHISLSDRPVIHSRERAGTIHYHNDNIYADHSVILPTIALAITNDESQLW
jgi:hypothetical protein